MTHLTSITSTQFSKFAVANAPIPDGFWDSELEYFDLFRATSLVNTNDHPIIYFGSMRDIPQTGTPANIVKVPVYGEDQSFSIGAQPDSPDLEFTLNLEPEVWAEGVSPNDTNEFHKSQIKRITGNGKEYAMAFFYLNSKTENPITRPGASNNPVTLGASQNQVEVEYNALGPKANSCMFFRGRVESVLYNPMRDDASTATVTLSITSPDFYGLFTADNTIKFIDDLDSPLKMSSAAGGLSGRTLQLSDYIKLYDGDGAKTAGHYFKASVNSGGPHVTGVTPINFSNTATTAVVTGGTPGAASIKLEVRKTAGGTTLDEVNIPITMSA